VSTVNFLVREVEGLRRNWGWFLALGIALVVLGMIALGCAVTTTIVSLLLFGWFLLIGGVIEIVHAFWVRQWSGFFLELLLGVLQVVVGWMIVEQPIEAGVTLTLMIAVFFIFGGVFRMVTAATMPFEGRGWLFFSGLVDLVLGVLIWRKWPTDALWLIGMFIGINLIFHGWWLVMLSLSVRSSIPAAPPAGPSVAPPPAV
jgi:uncharacterized membrane protein HdeD (DUF308 family)